MGEAYPPTASDFAYAASQENKTKLQQLEEQVDRLEKTVNRLVGELRRMNQHDNS